MGMIRCDTAIIIMHIMNIVVLRRILWKLMTKPNTTFPIVEAIDRYPIRRDAFVDEIPRDIATLFKNTNGMKYPKRNVAMPKA
jgi:hypothetical protein